MRKFDIFKRGLSLVIAASLLIQPITPIVAWANETKAEAAAQNEVGHQPQAAVDNMEGALEILDTPSEKATGDKSPAAAIDDQADIEDSADDAIEPMMAGEPPVPGADGPTSPTDESTHIDISASDLLTEEQIAEAQTQPADGTPRSKVSFAQLLLYAEQYVGLPYVWGGKHPSEGGFDCSGFVNWVYNHVAGTNINSYMTSAAGIYSDYCTPISEGNARPGDLVFWKYTYGTSKNYITHVGIYCGDGITLNAGDPIGYDRVDSVKNVDGKTATRVYGRLKGVTVTNEAPRDLNKLGQLHVPDVWHTGKAVNPPTYVTIAGKTLTAGVDYSVNVSNNVNIGTGKVTIAGKGAYSGSLSTTFDIVDPSSALPAGNYEFVSALPGGKVMDIKNGSKKAGEITQLYSSNGTTAQQFQVERTSNGYYTIKNAGSGLYLSSSTLIGLDERVLLSQEKADGTNRQKWMIKKQGDSYVISSAWDSRYVIDVKNAKNANGTNVQMWTDNDSTAQRWKARKVTTMRDRLDALAAQNRSVLADGVYRVASKKSSGAVLDVKNNSTANSTTVQLYKYNGTDAQHWRVSHDSKGYVTLTGVNSGKPLDVASAKAANGTGCGIYSSNGTWAQKWIAVKDGSSIKLVSALNNRFVLDARNAATSNGTRIQVYSDNGTAAQRWVFTASQSMRSRLDSLAAQNRSVLTDGVYRITSKNSSTAALDVKNNSSANRAVVQLYKSNGTSAQRWRVSHDSKGYITLTGVGSNKPLDVAGAKVANSTGCGIYAANDTWAQKWIAVKDGSSIKLVSALDSRYVLDARSARTSNGTKVQIYSDNGTAAQRWIFEII